jgi:hypothetical protein
MFCPNNCKTVNYVNHLEVVVNQNNDDGIKQVEKFMNFINKNNVKTTKGIRYLSVNNIVIRYYNNSGQMKEIFKGIELKENNFEDIMKKIE